MKEKQIKKLKNIFGKKRVSTKPRDRIPASHDLVSLPSFVKNRIDYEPEVVVQPKNEEEIKKLIELSTNQEIPLVPRGSGTSAYGGSVPTAGGISISFAQMRGINEINEDESTVTVKPGTIWDDPSSTDLSNIDKTLNSYLQEKGYEIPAYPSSAPGSTIAGWVAEGGAGIGSFEFGEIRDLVKKIRLVNPKGEHVLTGSDLDHVIGAEGTTGIITEIELRIKEKEEKTNELFAFDSAKQAIDFIEMIYEKELDFWHIQLLNPKHIQKQQEATGEEKLPENNWLVLINYPKSKKIKDHYPLSEKKNGELLQEELANYLWQERYFPLRYKRIGPSEIASESYVPIDKLYEYIENLYEINDDFILDSKLIKNGEAYNLVSVLTDERAPSYYISAMTQIEFDEAAKDAGGSVYGIGMFNLDDAKNHFGERFEELVDYKKSIDEEELINPGKIFRPNKRGKGVLTVNRLMSIAGFFTPLKGVASFVLSNKPNIKNDEDLPEETRYESFACSRCNYCTEVCDQWAGSKWESQSPKGRWTFLRQYLSGNEKWDQEIVESFLLCTTCKRCDEVCQSNIPILEIWDKIRGPLIQDKGFATFPGFEMMKASVDIENNIWGGPKEDRMNWLPDGGDLDE